MLKPVCVPCQRFFRCKKNDFRFVEAMPVGHDLPRPGTEQPDQWKPYKIWSSDRWECEGCGAAILVGFGNAPLAEHYDPEFVKTLRLYGADQLQVNDV